MRIFLTTQNTQFDPRARLQVMKLDRNNFGGHGVEFGDHFLNAVFTVLPMGAGWMVGSVGSTVPASKFRRHIHERATEMPSIRFLPAMFAPGRPIDR